MGILVKFANAARKHWVGLATSGAFIGLLTCEGPRNNVPPSVYWVFAIVLASYFTWLVAQGIYMQHSASPSGFDPDMVEVPLYANVYVEQVIGEYESLRSATPASLAAPDPRPGAIIKDYRDFKKTTWGELYRLERLLVQLETPEALRARIVPLRAR